MEFISFLVSLKHEKFFNLPKSTPLRMLEKEEKVSLDNKVLDKEFIYFHSLLRCTLQHDNKMITILLKKKKIKQKKKENVEFLHTSSRVKPM